jgi:hypothetical protein
VWEKRWGVERKRMLTWAMERGRVRERVAEADSLGWLA